MIVHEVGFQTRNLDKTIIKYHDHLNRALGCIQFKSKGLGFDFCSGTQIICPNPICDKQNNIIFDLMPILKFFLSYLPMKELPVFEMRDNNQPWALIQYTSVL